MPKLDEGAQILFDTICYNLRHQDYKRVIEVAEDFTAYATGYGLDKKLKRIVGRESDKEFAQRLALTQFNTPDIHNSTIKPMYKVGRTPASIHVGWNGKGAEETAKRKKTLFDAGKKFWGKKNVDKYIGQRTAETDGTDPNSFCIVEFKEDVDPRKPDIKANPYPFEANSAEAINYIYKNQELQWIVVLNHIVIKDKKGIEHVGEKYYSYFENHGITATQIHREVVKDYAIENNIPIIEDITAIQTKQIYIVSTNEKEKANRRYYVIRANEHKMGFVPAKRFGCIPDPLTRGRTCIPVITPAQSYFEKSIKTMSEFDLTMILHTFPQKLQYADPCPGEHHEGGWIGCQHGFRPDGKTVCGACKGSGFKVHTSSQDIIQIRMPKTLQEIVSLEGMLVYKSPPIDLVKFQEEFGFSKLRHYAQGAVYNSEVFSKDEVAQTATGKSIDLDAVYDTLRPYADNWSEMWVFIYTCIATLRDISEGLEISHSFPNDFKMKSLTQLLEDWQKATTNGAPSHVKKALGQDINRKIYADRPEELLKIETKDKYFPFPGKAESEINFIIANDLTTRFNKILYAHFDMVFSEIEFEQGEEQKDFYQMDGKMQRDLIKKKVESIIEALDAEEEENTATAFGSDIGEPGATPKLGPDGKPLPPTTIPGKEGNEEGDNLDNPTA